MRTFASLFLTLVSSVLAVVHNTVEPGVNTECKTCPWSLCTNVAAYGYENDHENVTLTCYTRGEVIGDDRTWLKTTDNCYVTQYDLLDYPEYETDLPYCGRDSEKEFYKTQAAATKYNTECNRIPSIDSDNVQYVHYNTPLTVTCYTVGDLIIDDSTWLKTTSNCYVAQIGLTHPATLSTLDDCGPIPFLEVNYTDPDGGVDTPDGPLKERTPLPVTLPTDLEKKDELAKKETAELNKRYLISVHAGEDYALCHTNATLASPVKKRYPFDAEIRLQCLVIDFDAGANETYWSE